MGSLSVGLGRRAELSAEMYNTLRYFFLRAFNIDGRLELILAKPRSLELLVHSAHAIGWITDFFTLDRMWWFISTS